MQNDAGQQPDLNPEFKRAAQMKFVFRTLFTYNIIHGCAWTRCDSNRVFSNTVEARSFVNDSAPA